MTLSDAFHRQPVDSEQEDRELAATVEAYLIEAEAGRPPDQEEFLASHPRIADRLRVCLQNLTALRQAQSAWQVHARDEDPLPCFEGYEVLREIGRGGMGIVYEAREKALDRIVALKLLPFAAVLDPRWLQRFRNEALATAQMHHPHIVPVYSVARERGAHFFTMPLIEGRSVAEIIAELRSIQRSLSERKNLRPSASDSVQPPKHVNSHATSVAMQDQSFGSESTRWPLLNSSHYFRAIAKLGLQTADALQYSHSLSVIHRDIKPSNLLVDLTGNLWITDFGLARISSAEDVTLSGDLLGTARYMSPEQAAGRRELVDHRTDIYSLGATLYELATLRPIVDRENRHDQLDQIKSGRMTLPRDINRSIPVDLETIILRAIDPQRDARYVSAQAMAVDLNRFVHGQPVFARRISVSERIGRFIARHRTLLAVLSLFLTLLLVISFWGLSRSLEAARERESQQTAARLLAEQSLYKQRIARADLEFINGSLSRSEELLDQCPLSQRGWEWHSLKRRCRAELMSFDHPKGPLLAVDFSSDGQQVVTGSQDGRISVWNLTDRSLASQIEFPDVVYVVNFSPDNQWLAAAGREWTAHRPAYVRVYDARTGDLRHDLVGHERTVSALTFHPQRNELLTAGWDGRIFVWNLETGQPVKTLGPYPSSFKSISLDPRENQVIVGGTGGHLMVWDLESGEPIVTLQQPSDVQTATFNHDGSRCAVSLWSGLLKVYDTANWSELYAIHASNAQITDLIFSPQGQRLAFASTNGSIHLLETQFGTEQFSIRGHDGLASAISFSPSGDHLASVGRDRSLKIWDVRNSPQRPMIDYGRGRTPRYGLASDAHGSRLALAPWGHAGADLSVAVFDCRSWQYALTSCRQPNGFHTVDLSPDGDQLIVDCGSTICLWSISKDEEIGRYEGHTDAVTCLAFAPSGEHFASASRDGTVRLWDTSPPSLGKVLTTNADPLNTIAFDHSGEYLIAGGASGKGYVWQSASGRLKYQQQLEQGELRDIQCHPHLPLAASIGNAETIRIWRLENGRQVRSLVSRTGSGYAICFSHDGKRLLSSGDDGSVRCWDWQEGEELLRLDGTSAGQKALEFDPQGKWLVAATNETHTMDVWDLRPYEARSGKMLTTKGTTGMK